jgi:hypothetical protein
MPYVPLIVGTVRWVEGLFGRGQGANKKKVATEIIDKAAETMKAVGTLADRPQTVELANLIEVIVQVLKAMNVLTPATPAAPPPLVPQQP